MDVEARLLLYSVVLGAAVGLVQLIHRRAYAFRAYMAELAVLLVVSSVALLLPEWTLPVAWPAFWTFIAVAIAPSALIETARQAARARRYRAAWASAGAGALLLGRPKPLAREAALYGALAAAESGDAVRCRARLEKIARGVGIPEELGGDALVRVLPAAARRDWAEVLAAIDAAPYRPPALLAVEVRAAGDTGDLRRALRACRAIEAIDSGSLAARHSARRALLSSAGRAQFLEEASARRLPVVAGPRGTAELAVARAREALGDAAGASQMYARARAVGCGGVKVDAEAGAARCASGQLLLARTDELELASLLDLEASCRDEPRAPEEIPLWRRAPFSIGASVATTLATVLVFTLLGKDTLSLVAAGALSAPLVRDHDWWRLGTAMLLHGSWFHVSMNVATILFVGLPLESRIGPSRTAIVYLGSGFLASTASVYLSDTPVGVGASGAAMGLVGALCALLVRRPALFHDAERRRWIGALSIFVVAIFAIGIKESESIDNTAHAVGFLAGGLVGWLLLPGALEDSTHAAMRRLCALALCGVMADCVWVASNRLPEWRGEQVVEAQGARATFPSWLHSRPTKDGGVVLARPPLTIAAHLGAAPATPSPVLLSPPEKAQFVEQQLQRGPSRRRRAPPETVDYLDRNGEGFRLTTFRAGGAFLVVFNALGPDEDEEADEALVARLGATLGAVE